MLRREGLRHISGPISDTLVYHERSRELEGLRVVRSLSPSTIFKPGTELKGKLWIEIVVILNHHQSLSETNVPIPRILLRSVLSTCSPSPLRLGGEYSVRLR